MKKKTMKKIINTQRRLAGRDGKGKFVPLSRFMRIGNYVRSAGARGISRGRCHLDYAVIHAASDILDAKFDGYDPINDDGTVLLQWSNNYLYVEH